MADPEEVVKMNPDIVTIRKRVPGVVCHFCQKGEINDLEWGPMYKLKDVVVHYFCMLFSSALTQNGNDNEGILGFLVDDLKKEMRRGDKLKCKYCKKNRATVGCIIAQCKAMFHFSCGIANGTLHYFAENFASYCPKHKPKHDIPFSVPEEGVLCEVCQENVKLTDNYVWPPCCKLRLFHRTCIQEYARTAGYSFSCPSCKSTDEFIAAMKKSGVYIPDQDAAWERDPNFFRELSEIYSRCDAEDCYCPKGRDYDASKHKPYNRNWKIIRCGACGASAVHYCCGQLKLMKWKCRVCLEVMSRDCQAFAPASSDSDDDSSDDDGRSNEDKIVNEYENIRQIMANQARLGVERFLNGVRHVADVLTGWTASIKVMDGQLRLKDGSQLGEKWSVEKRRVRLNDYSHSNSSKSKDDSSELPTHSNEGRSDNHRTNWNSFSQKLRALRLSTEQGGPHGPHSSCVSSCDDVVCLRSDALVPSLKLSNLDLSEFRSFAASDVPPVKICDVSLVEAHELSDQLSYAASAVLTRTVSGAEVTPASAAVCISSRRSNFFARVIDSTDVNVSTTDAQARQSERGLEDVVSVSNSVTGQAEVAKSEMPESIQTNHARTSMNGLVIDKVVPLLSSTPTSSTVVTEASCANLLRATDEDTSQQDSSHSWLTSSVASFAAQSPGKDYFVDNSVPNQDEVQVISVDLGTNKPRTGSKRVQPLRLASNSKRNKKDNIEICPGKQTEQPADKHCKLLRASGENKAGKSQVLENEPFLVLNDDGTLHLENGEVLGSDIFLELQDDSSVKAVRRINVNNDAAGDIKVTQSRRGSWRASAESVGNVSMASQESYYSNSYPVPHDVWHNRRCRKKILNQKSSD